jgi:hypothetical protein
MNCSPSGRALRAADMVELPPMYVYRMEGGRLELEVCGTLYSCGCEEPCRWLQCGFEVVKVNGKTPNFHSFLGISLEISLFSQVFAVFAPLRRDFGRIFPV